MLVQIVITLIILFIISRLVIKFRARVIPGAETILWLIFWVAAAVVVLLPETTSFVARRLGVGRGVDLAIYLAIIIIFYIIFHLSVRLRKIEGNITKIVRHLAVEDKKTPNS
jgi:hypothetical protein